MGTSRQRVCDPSLLYYKALGHWPDRSLGGFLQLSLNWTSDGRKPTSSRDSDSLPVPDVLYRCTRPSLRWTDYSPSHRNDDLLETSAMSRILTSCASGVSPVLSMVMARRRFVVFLAAFWILISMLS